LAATTMALVSAVSAAVLTASPLAGPTEHSKRTSSTVCVTVCNIGRGDAGMGMRVRGHTCSRTAVLAGEEGLPSPAVRPGPIHGMGRAVRLQAHPLTGTARCTPLSKSTDERAHVRRTACASEEAVSARRDNHDDAGLDVEHGRSRPNTGNALHRAGIARVSGQSIECCFAGPRRTRCAAAEAEKKHQRQGDARTAEGTARPAQRDSCKAWAVAGEPSTAHYRERTLWGFFVEGSGLGHMGRPDTRNAGGTTPYAPRSAASLPLQKQAW
jgi:hypothetical protein